ncbi:MAG: hypothetical protein ACRDQ5_14415 [Sciscionella sp.]
MDRRGPLGNLPAHLRDVLADGERRRFAVIINALDEASDPTQARTIITDIMVPIAARIAAGADTVSP